MRRIRLAVVLAFSLVLAPIAAAAQQGGKVYRIGYLSVSQIEFDKSWVGAFQDGLCKLGYVEGQNPVIEQRHAAGHSERFPGLAAELLGLKIDILVVYGAWLLPKKLPRMIPIVFTVAPDPVREGLIASLAHPGGNITGLSDIHADLAPSDSSYSRRSSLRHLLSRSSSIRAVPRPCSNCQLSRLQPGHWA